LCFFLYHIFFFYSSNSSLNSLKSSLDWILNQPSFLPYLHTLLWWLSLIIFRSRIKCLKRKYWHGNKITNKKYTILFRPKLQNGKRGQKKRTEALKYANFHVSNLSQQDGSKLLLWSWPYAAISKASALPKTSQIR